MGVGIFIILSFVRVGEFLGGSWIAGLLLVESASVVWLLLTRNQASQESPWIIQAAAWASAFLPFAFQLHGPDKWWALLLAIVGIVIKLWAMWTLGKSFSIAPADRGLVTRGPYQLVRHPMYAAALITTIGATINHLNVWNYIVWLVLVLSIIGRIVYEEQLLAGYQEYKQKVRWRIVPLVW
jgi:protein-S-isoprenylcysteine O-methyltransferase Ste14